jgi:hypothetical protein
MCAWSTTEGVVGCGILVIIFGPENRQLAELTETENCSMYVDVVGRIAIHCHLVIFG